MFKLLHEFWLDVFQWNSSKYICIVFNSNKINDFSWYYILSWKNWFWLAETHLTKLISPAKSFHHTLTRDGTWQWSILHDNGICLNNIDCTECVHVQFIGSVWHHLSVLIEILRNARSYLSFLNQTLYLINIQYNMIICPVQEGKTSYCNLQTNINYPWWF